MDKDKDTESLTDLSRRFTERQSRFREAFGTDGSGAELTREQILAWADAHHAAHGVWPAVGPGTVSGVVDGAPGESWRAINHALALALRGLSGDSSLAELLAEHRGAPRPDMSPQALANKIWAWEQEQFPVKGPKRRSGGGRHSLSLTIGAILAWADAHREAAGAWPKGRSGTVRNAPHEVTWTAIDQALVRGRHGLPGGSSLARLLGEHRGVRIVRSVQKRPGLTIDEILAWADAHHAATGEWPTGNSGPVRDAPYDLKWSAIYAALVKGQRGLSPGSSLSDLLAKHRGVQPRPLLTLDQILAWADAHHEATGAWPAGSSGPVRDAPGGETWAAVYAALKRGQRGLPGNITLSELLAERRDVRPRPPLTLDQIVTWADAHHAALGTWPNSNSGKVQGASLECWSTLDHVLKNGGRGLPGGLSIARLLAERRSVWAGRTMEPLHVEQVLAWADAFHDRHGRWPDSESGPVDPGRGETWCAINSNLTHGARGLPGGTTLARFLIAHRGPTATNRAPRLTVERIFAWIDAHHAATGCWPNRESGDVAGVPGESWRKIDLALKNGNRGLSRGASLAKLLIEHRGVRDVRNLPKLTIDQILTWADEYQATHGRWPVRTSGAIPGAPDESWGRIFAALHTGYRGLPPGSSLPRLLADHRSAKVMTRIACGGGNLRVEQILAWADAHHAEHGVWPVVGASTVSGAVAGVQGDPWKAINYALALGRRGLPGDSSLAELLAEHRGAPLPDMGPMALADKTWAWEQEQLPVRGRLRRRVVQDCPRLTIDKILAWADAHQAATGDWPACKAGRVNAAPFDVTWRAIDCALRGGLRGLPGGVSLFELLREYRGVRPPLTHEQILAWADAHHAAEGTWPKYLSGNVVGAPGETWVTVDTKLRVGGRGLPGGSSLARLLADHRGTRYGNEVETLSVEQVLAWADAYHATHGRWPDYESGQVDPVRRETWCAINSALTTGRRGLPGGTSLARLLIECRGPEASNRPSRLSVEQVLAWADAHHASTGRWPHSQSGPVTESPHITWAKIDRALFHGNRGLPGGSSVRQLLAQHRGLFNRRRVPKLTIDQIMAWADAYYAAHHYWPTKDSGRIPGTHDETWTRIDKVLLNGRRGLPSNMSLRRLIVQQRSGIVAPAAECKLSPREAELLADRIRAWEREHFPARRPRRPGALPSCPSLTIDAILAWADAHHAATGNWPTDQAGRVHGAPFELTWAQVASALSNGHRGLPGKRTLRSLLVEQRNVGPRRTRRVLSVEQILAWVDAFQSEHGHWPSAASGAVAGAPGERWSAIDCALREGRYGLSGGTTLLRLIAEHRDPDARLHSPRLTVEQILAWMDANRASTGRWPTADSGQVQEASPGLTWSAIAQAVRNGQRGLPAGLTLAGLRKMYREPRPELTVERILAWADAHHAARGSWPTSTSGRIEETSRETWSIINRHLVRGGRGLPGGQNLACFLLEHRGARIKSSLPPLRVERILES